jgi:hypothetical protein
MNIINRSENDFVTLYKTKDLGFRVYDQFVDEYYSTNNYPKDRRAYHLFKNYSLTDESLKNYAKNMIKWTNELQKATLNKNETRSIIDFSKMYSLQGGIIITFNYFCAKKYKSQHITCTEYKWYEICGNSSHQYLDEKCKNTVVYDCYGFDYNKYYCRLLGSDFLIPINQGEECKLKELYFHKLLHGFYRCKITGNKNFRKIFTYNSENVYLKEYVEFAYENRKEYDVEIELIIDGDYNALLYKTRDMRPISSVTKDWYEYMMKINSEFNENGIKNQLFKMIASSTWGTVSETNTINVEYDDIDDYDIGPIGDENHDYCIINEIQSKKKHYYELLNNMNPYKFNLRLKPFITCAGRIKIAKTMLKAGIDNVFRCHTDGIVLYKNFAFNDPTIWTEEKTSGSIHWLNNNNYKNIYDKDYSKWLSDNNIEEA